MALPQANALTEVVRRVVAERSNRDTPYVIAIDGRSGVGKSTFAASLARLLDAAIVDGDAFYAGGVELRADTPRARAEACIDWRRLAAVLESLRASRAASFHPFDWETFDGSLSPDPVEIAPAPVMIVEGVYSARPELAHLVDLRILLRVPDAVRMQRLIAREGSIGPWERQWHEAERWYFATLMPDAAFDLVIDNA